MQKLVWLPRLGSGAYASVYKAYSATEHRYYAIKIIKISNKEPFVERFSRLRSAVRELDVRVQVNVKQLDDKKLGVCVPLKHGGCRSIADSARMRQVADGFLCCCCSRCSVRVQWSRLRTTAGAG